MSSKDNPILSSHRDAATRVIKYFQSNHNISLKQTTALEVVAQVLGAANWQTLRAMADQGRAPRMLEVAAGVSATPVSADAEKLHRSVADSMLHVLQGLGGQRSLPQELIAQLRNPQTAIQQLVHRRNIQLTPEQANAIEMASQYPVTLFTGDAGSGITFAATSYAEILKDLGAQVYDARGRNGLGKVLEAWQAKPVGGANLCSLLLLDESAFENLSQLANLIIYLPFECRVVIGINPLRVWSDTALHLIERLEEGGRVGVARFSQRLRQEASM